MAAQGIIGATAEVEAEAGMAVDNAAGPSDSTPVAMRRQVKRRPVPIKARWGALDALKETLIMNRRWFACSERERHFQLHDFVFITNATRGKGRNNR